MTTALISLLAARADSPSTMDAERIYRLAKDSVVAIQATTKEGTAMGTGFFFGDSKTVATCEHVIDGATKILIKGTKGAIWKPASMSFDRAGDTVLLHLDATTNRVPLHSAKGATQIGEPVCVIGNQLGVLTGSLTTGIVSASRSIASVPLLQMTAPISEGSSGSPVLDSRGHVRGMVSFTFSEGQNLNMAIEGRVLNWVAADRRVCPLAAYYASNTMPGAALRMVHRPTATAARTLAKARGAFIEQIAQYDGRVIDAFVRWQEATLAWQRGQGGIGEPDVQKAYEAFGTAVSGKDADDALTQMAKDAGQPDYYEHVRSSAASLMHIAQDKVRQDAEVVHTSGSTDAAKRDAAQYGRLVQALCEFGAASEDPTWMDVESLYANFPTPAKGECIMLHQGAFVDADLPRSTVLRDALPNSVFLSGDEVKGARVAGTLQWTRINTWEDLWQFTADHPHVSRVGWEVQVLRDSKPLTLSMCAAHRG